MLVKLKILLKKSMANYVNKQHSLVESRNQNQANKIFLFLKSIVGDEIQRHEVETRRGWAREEKLR
jgi:hypothetical protein